MAEVKWIKLSTDLFNNRKIKQIRKLPDGDSIIGTWLQILCLAGEVNNGGLVYFSKDIPYTDDMLAAEFDRPISTIRLALKTFETFGMMHLVDDVLCVSNWEKYQSQEKLETIKEYNRLKKREYRERQQIKRLSLTCPGQVSGSPQTDNISISNSLSKSNKYKLDIYTEYCKGNLELLNAFKNWEEMRKNNKNKMTDQMRKLSITALEKITTNPIEQVETINHATLNGWKSFYPIKKENKQSGNPFKDRLQKEIENEQDRSNSSHGCPQSGIPKLLQGNGG